MCVKLGVSDVWFSVAGVFDGEVCLRLTTAMFSACPFTKMLKTPEFLVGDIAFIGDETNCRLPLNPADIGCCMDYKNNTNPPIPINPNPAISTTSETPTDMNFGASEVELCEAAILLITAAGEPVKLVWDVVPESTCALMTVDRPAAAILELDGNEALVERLPLLVDDRLMLKVEMLAYEFVCEDVFGSVVSAVTLCTTVVMAGLSGSVRAL